MAKPRPIISGSTYRVVRRTLLGLPRLEPNAITNQVLFYCLALAAAKTGVLVHAFVVMGNYHEITITDPRGQVPVFLREFHRSVAKCLNAVQGQSQVLWAPEQTCLTCLPSVEDILDQVVKTAITPVKTGLVDHAGQWPGLLIWKPGSRITALRPNSYFDQNGSAPASLELRIEPPVGGRNQAGWAERLARAVLRGLRCARRAVRTSAKHFAEATCEAAFRELRRPPNSTVKSRYERVRDSYERAYHTFQVEYRIALMAWRRGVRSVPFPFGTWDMNVHHGAKVAPRVARTY